MSDETVTKRRATLEDLAELEAAGYRVDRIEPLNSAAGWTLTDPDGAYLMIGDHGCVAPSQWQAVAEGLARIAMDCRAEAEFRRAHYRGEVSPLFAPAPFQQIRGQLAASWDGEPLYSAETSRELEQHASEAAINAAIEAGARAELEAIAREILAHPRTITSTDTDNPAARYSLLDSATRLAALVLEVHRAR